MLKLLTKLALLLLACVCAGVLVQQTTLSALALSRVDPLPHTRELVSAARYAEAADYLGFFMDYDYVSSNPEAQALHHDIVRQRESWRYRFEKLSEGLVLGSSDEPLGIAAAVVTDFLVIGDIRDLTRQGLHLARDEEVDEVLVALSTLGLVASTAQLASGAGTLATAGATAPAAAGATAAKSGIVALKTARRLGHLPPWLGKTLVRTAKTARQSKGLSKLNEAFASVTTLARTRGGFRLMAKTRNADELAAMARFARTFGDHSRPLYRLGGRLAVDLAGTVSKETVKLAATFGKGGLRLLNQVGAVKFTKIASRSAKMAYKGEVFRLLARALFQLPPWLLSLLMMPGLLLCIPWRWLLDHRRKRRAGRRECAGLNGQ
ncbi:hypothetical protein PU634_08465 [Oceanimonas pelagia]|uniref:Uncharacterized protein n=1 Tax=Oceanimonas pelagia TaxID=3028314 RepID=A0AA50QBU4_9GAMM|nr:hypothetical protein [Oceanimonas pelagia]WMC12383.1 hypothetical protein PU634_08465 [Oceanimonas pelagia]